MPQTFVVHVNVDSINMDDVALPIVYSSDAKRHASSLSIFLLDNPLYF